METEPVIFDTQMTSLNKLRIYWDDDLPGIRIEFPGYVTKEDIDQLGVFVEAFNIYREREAKYGGAWKRYGALNNLVRLGTKAERLVQEWWRNEGGPPYEQRSLDDAFDLINYAAFFVRQAMQGQWRSDGTS